MGKIKITEGSGNVFADLGIEKPSEALRKAKLASDINEVIARRAYTQAEAAAVLGISQPRVSALQRGRLNLFSISKLIELAELLGAVIVFKWPDLDSQGFASTGTPLSPTSRQHRRKLTR